MKKVLSGILAAGILFGAVGCTTRPADTASYNISLAADNFQVLRRVVFYNGISGEYIITVEGYCSLGNFDKDGELSVTCQVGPGIFKKHFLGLSDNVTYFAEQIEPIGVSQYHYKVIFRPASIIPDIEIQ